MEVKNIEILSSTLHKSLNSIYSVIENKPLVAILEDFLFACCYFRGFFI